MFQPPDNLRELTLTPLTELAAELRSEIIRVVAQQGGHLASNLGAVELTIALHRIFDIPGQDTVYFDVGHQAYAHKLLTGRGQSFQGLRSADGCSGFPRPEESLADPVYAGHAGVAISQALGDAAARHLNHLGGKAIAVIGDGAMSCGIPWEALNNIRTGGKNLVIILNDNQMSIAPGRGTLRRCLNRIIAGKFYNSIREAIPAKLRNERFWKRFKNRLKSFFMPPSVLFQELGLRYIGPVNGNRLEELLPVLRMTKEHSGPLLVHVVTQKGHGCTFAEEEPSLYHGVNGFNPETGALPPSNPDTLSYSKAFGNEVCRLADTDPKVVAISAAMLDGTGLSTFAKLFPERCFDTGIAEEHAAAFASGLALRGQRPVLALYSTFLQRALDNVYHDICLNNLPVILGIDRAGAVADGPTHHGIYDLAFLQQLPNLTIMAPADAADMHAMMEHAYELGTPAAIRYPRGNINQQALSEAPLVHGKARVLRNPATPQLAIWGLGAECATALAVAKLLEPEINAMVIDPRFVTPFDSELARSLTAIPQVVIEDHCTSGGLGSCLQHAVAHLPHQPILCCGWPANIIIPHGTTGEIRERFGLTPAALASTIREFLNHV